MKFYSLFAFKSHKVLESAHTRSDRRLACNVSMMTKLFSTESSFNYKNAIKADKSLSFEHSTPRMLSIQSHTVHGYVGNKACTFPLQCLGFNVDTINSITLSNHPGAAYGTFKGQAIDATFYRNLIQGLEANKLLNYDVVLTGYTNSVEILKEHYSTVKTIKKYNKNVLYICDPVLGDHGKYYVPENLLHQYRTLLLPLANVITPNQFEIEQLVEMKINNLKDVSKICHFMHTKFPHIKVCILKGIHFANGRFSMVISYSNKIFKESNLMMDSNVDRHMRGYDYLYSSTALKRSYNPYSSSSSGSMKNDEKVGSNRSEADDITIYKIDLDRITSRHFSGCGDLVSAVAAAFIYYLSEVQRLQTTLPQSQSSPDRSARILQPYFAAALEQLSDTVHRVLKLTELRGSTEICVVESADIFIETKRNLHQLANSAAQAIISTAATENNSDTPNSDEDLNRKKSQTNNKVTAAFPSKQVLLSLLNSRRSDVVKGGRVMGVIFDMDGTLTMEGAIDFASMYSRTRLLRDKLKGDILSQIKALPSAEDRQRCYKIIHEEEMRGCERQVLREGFYELFESLCEQRIRVAIATRNCHDAAVKFLEQAQLPPHLFTHILHRNSLPMLPCGSIHLEMPISLTPYTGPSQQQPPEDAADEDSAVYINKPDRRVADIILDHWDLSDPSYAKKTLFVCDSLDDMLCGKNAGCLTCLVITEENEQVSDDPKYKHLYDYKVRTLTEIIDVINR